MQLKELTSVFYLRQARMISKGPHIKADRLGSMYILCEI